MLKNLFQQRSLALTTTLIAAAFIICGLAWGRFFSVAAANPSPVRYMDFVTTDGTRAPFQQDCAGPSFIEADAVWRFCAYYRPAGDGSAQWGLVRFDMDAGRAVLRWPLPEDPTAQVLSLARAANGVLALAWGSPDLASVYTVYPDGGVDALGVPDDAGPVVSGMAWVPDALEIVTTPDDESEVWVSAYTQGEGPPTWLERRTTAPPDACTDDTVCDYQFAHYSDEGWLFLYAIAPVEFDDPAQASVEFVLADEDGASLPVDSVPLADLDPAQIILDDAGRLVRFGSLFDNAPGNVVNWSLDAAPFMLHGGTWERVATPPVGTNVEASLDDLSFYFSNYQIEDNGLRWIPGLRYPTPGWQFDEWLMLRSSGEGIALGTYDGRSGPTLTDDPALAAARTPDLTLLPASDGGYWLLGPNGSYVKADRALNRDDELNVVERVGRTFENFDRLEAVNNDEFYRGQRVLKMAAFPLVLLSLPAGYLLVFFLGQTQHNRRRWYLLLAQVSAGYVIVATVFIWWFWELMDNF